MRKVRPQWAAYSESHTLRVFHLYLSCRWGGNEFTGLSLAMCGGQCHSFCPQIIAEDMMSLPA